MYDKGEKNMKLTHLAAAVCLAFSVSQPSWGGDKSIILIKHSITASKP